MRICGFIPVLSSFCLVALCLSSCEKPEEVKEPQARSQAEAPLSDFTWSGIGFGIEMSTQLHSVTEQQADAISNETEQRLASLEQAFSLYLEQSELSILNRERSLQQPSSEFLALLELARSLHSRTGGYYQPAIHGAWSALDSRATDPQQWKDQCAAASLDFLQISPDKVELTNPLTQLSFNAIVQGHLADQMKDVVLKAGVESALLHLGETYAVGAHPEGRPWELAVMGTPVDDEIDLVGTVSFSNAGLAVSAHDASRPLLNPTNWNVQQSDRVVAIVTDEGAAVADAFATAFAVAPQSAWTDLHAALLKGGKCQVKIWVENQLAFEK